MAEHHPPSVDIRAPDGRRIVLHPTFHLAWLPQMGPVGLSAVVVLSAIWLLTSCYRLNHTDLWDHLNFGRWIVQHGALPTADPFRDFVPTMPVVLQDWLAQVLGFVCHEWFGVEGLVAAHALLVTLTCGILMAACRARRTPLGWAVGAAAAAYVLGAPVIGTIRPQLLGMLAFSLTLLGAARLPQHRDPLFWLPAVFVGWANTHGSFPVGLAVLGATALGYSLERWFGGVERGAGLRLWAALGLAVVATCANPYGPGLLPYVAQFRHVAALEDIAEWRPMTLGTLSGGLFAVSLIASAVLLRISPRRVSLSEAFIALGLGVLAVSSMRMLTWWALAWPWLAAPHAAAAWNAWKVRNRKALGNPPAATTDDVEPSLPHDEAGHVGSGEDENDEPPVPLRTLLAVAVVFIALIWSPPTHALLSGQSRPEASVLGRATPRKAAAWLVENHVAGRVFCPMDWGSYFIWKTEGRVAPLVHTHVPLTTPEVWNDYLQIARAELGWRIRLERYRLDYLIMDRAREGRLIRSVASEPEWLIVYEDDQAVVAARDKR